MKKRAIILLSIVLFVSLFIFFSININNQSKIENKSQNTNENKISNDFKQKHEYVATIDCPALKEDIIGFDYDYIVTKNKVYQYNIEKLFSNDKNCKEIPIENLNSEIVYYKASAFETKDSEYIYDDKSKKFYKSTNGQLIHTKFNNLGDNVIVSIMSDIRGYTILSVDNKIRLYKENYDIDSGTSTDEYKNIDYNFKDETVKSIINDYIKTDKAFYKVKRYKTNKEECDKYVDIKCKYNYTISKEKILSENYNGIKAINHAYIIDKDGNVYYN